MDHPLSTGQYTCTCPVYSTRDGVEWIWPLTDDQVHTQTCGQHVSQAIVCSYVPWWQECMLGWGVEGEGVSMKCCIIWRSSSWRNDWSPNRVIHIWINMFVCLYAGRCKLQVSVWPRNLTFGLILITHCHWDMRKCFVLYSNTRVVKHIPAEYTIPQGLWNIPAQYPIIF